MNIEALGRLVAAFSSELPSDFFVQMKTREIAARGVL
jgi:hypothetical protein